MDNLSKEVQKHYNQAVHNYRFFWEVHSKLPGAFYDWKITVLFYTALHLLRALMRKRGIEVSDSHQGLSAVINPNRSDPVSPVKKHCYDSYKILYNASLEVRYSGFLNPDKQSIYLKRRFSTCEEALKSIDVYMKSQDFPSLIPIQKEFDFDE